MTPASIGQSEVQRVADEIQRAASPVDLFGEVATGSDEALRTVTTVYHRLARVLHPDRVSLDERLTANVAFARLSELVRRARQEIQDGVYGRRVLFTLTAKAGTYEAQRHVATGDVADVYLGKRGDHAVLLKVARDSRNADLLATEARILRELQAALKDTLVLKAFIPPLLDTFAVKPSGRTVNVFQFEPALVSLADPRIPRPLDPRHVVWIMNRTLELLDVVNRLGAVHGAVWPEHLLIDPATHRLVVCGWGQSARVGDRVRVVSQAHQASYPPELMAKAPVGPGFDMYCLAQSMLDLVDQRTLPAAMRAFFTACLIRNYARRPSDTGALYEHWRELQGKLYGKPQFVNFKLKEGV